MTDAPATTSFAGLKTKQTTELNVIDPRTLQPSGWIWTLGSPSHPKAQAYSNKKRGENLARAATIEAKQANRRKVKPDDIVKTVDEEKEETAAWLVSRTVSFTPVNFGDGDITFSDEAATKFFLDPDFVWLTNGILEKLDDDTSFIENSAKK